MSNAFSIKVLRASGAYDIPRDSQLNTVASISGIADLPPLCAGLIVLHVSRTSSPLSLRASQDFAEIIRVVPALAFPAGDMVT
jgi:hypothetical protein